MYLDMSLRVAEESHAIRLKVGAIFVSTDGVMSMGINGLPPDSDNECENIEWCSGGGWIDPEEIEKNWPYKGTYKDTHGNEIEGRYRLKTKDEVSHAEENVFGKLMLQGVSTKGGTMFLTHSPCIHCAKIMVTAGVTHVYYLEDYRSMDGINWLVRNKVVVQKVEQ
jgi:dCMP deaminase